MADEPRRGPSTPGHAPREPPASDDSAVILASTASAGALRMATSTTRGRALAETWRQLVAIGENPAGPLLDRWEVGHLLDTVIEERALSQPCAPAVEMVNRTANSQSSARPVALAVRPRSMEQRRRG